MFRDIHSSRLVGTERVSTQRRSGVTCVMGQTDPEVCMANSKLLLVDDEPSMRSALTRALRFWGGGITLPADGAEAIAILGQHRPFEFSVAIVDLCMPRMDGHELLMEIKRRSRPRRLSYSQEKARSLMPSGRCVWAPATPCCWSPRGDPPRCRRCAGPRARGVGQASGMCAGEIVR